MDSVGCVPVDDSIQVWIPVVKSAWHEHSSSPGCQHHTSWLSLPGPRSGSILNCYDILCCIYHIPRRCHNQSLHIYVYSSVLLHGTGITKGPRSKGVSLSARKKVVSSLVV